MKMKIMIWAPLKLAKWTSLPLIPSARVGAADAFLRFIWQAADLPEQRLPV